MKAMGVSDGEWYSEVQDKGRWRVVWSQQLDEYQQAQVVRRGMWCVLSVGDISIGKGTRLTISVWQRGGNLTACE